MAASSIEMMECSSGAAAAPSIPGPSWEYHLRKYLMLLATLVATATYAAGLSPPGGVWQKTDLSHNHTAGVPILYGTARYRAFFYFNATAFATSLVVNLLLLALNKKRTTLWLAVLRLVMVLDLLALMGAFATGSCGDTPTTVYVSTLVVALTAYVGIQIFLAWYEKEETAQAAADALKLKEQRKVLLLLATFATGISYGAGLNPPGRDRIPVSPGVWETSGIIDTAEFYGDDTWIFDVQAHPPMTAPKPNTVEDGQLMMLVGPADKNDHDHDEDEDDD